jgi:hypothetical protein
MLVELRTPLTLIQAPLDQLLSSHGLGANVQYKLQLASRNCKRLKKLIDVSLFFLFPDFWLTWILHYLNSTIRPLPRPFLFAGFHDPSLSWT